MKGSGIWLHIQPREVWSRGERGRGKHVAVGQQLAFITVLPAIA